MPGGKGNIRPSDNPKPFNTPEGQKNANKKGRPRKTWKTINAELAAKGIEQVDRNTYYETVSRLMNMQQREMMELVAEPDTPQWLRWLCGDLSTKKIRAKIMSEYRDWMFGKAEQKTVTVAIGADIPLSEMNQEDTASLLRSFGVDPEKLIEDVDYVDVSDQKELPSPDKSKSKAKQKNVPRGTSKKKSIKKPKKK